MGGPDAEREVSLHSGEEVAAALRSTSNFIVTEQVIDRPSASELSQFECDIIFPALHGTWGEGGGLQRELETLGIPYVGSEPGPAALAMDKIATKRVLATLGVPTPPAQPLAVGDTCTIEPPVVLKPVDDGSSVDLYICKTRSEILRASDTLLAKRNKIMAESYIKGREITIGIVLGKLLPLIEIVPAVEFYDYDAKYERSDTQYRFDPDLPPDVAQQCEWIAQTAFDAIGCRDLARVDIMVDHSGPWFLEINTMPGFTTHSLVPMAAARTGVPMPELCAKLVEAALARTEQAQFQLVPRLSPML
jgi:D-alanine-D-alanine ligase